MVDRLINKTDRPAENYRVKSAAETRKDKEHEQQSQEEKKETHEKASQQNNKWQKYHGKNFTIRPMKVPGNQISKMLLRQALLSKGIPMLIIDVKWSNGKTTEGAIIRLKKMEDFIKARSIPTGTEIPINIWSAPEIELGIPTIIHPSGLHSMEEIENEEKNKILKLRRRRLVGCMIIKIILNGKF